MADSSDIDAALVAKLAGDATLAGYMQSGAFVFMDMAPPNSTKFVIVRLITEEDVLQFGGRSFESVLYEVEARMLASQSVALGNIKAAVARIDVLLENAVLTVAGFTSMATYREERTRTPEPDEADPTIVWHRRGGQYRVVMST